LDSAASGRQFGKATAVRNKLLIVLGMVAGNFVCLSQTNSLCLTNQSGSDAKPTSFNRTTDLEATTRRINK
jgi:hypothetical protein